MKKNLIKFLCLALVVVFVFSIAACGDKNTSPTDTDTGEASTDTGEASTDTGGASTDTGGTGGSYNCDQNIHNWGRWTYTDPTCTTAGSAMHECQICGRRQVDASYADEMPATGHSYSSWTSGVMCDERTCTVCGNKDVVEYENIAPRAEFKPGSDVWGSPTVVLDGNWNNEGAFATKGATFEFLFEFADLTYIDQIACAGHGVSTGYTVSVMDENGEWKSVGTGGFSGENATRENASKFIVGESVLAVRVNQTSGAIGQNYWDEIQIGVKPVSN